MRDTLKDGLFYYGAWSVFIAVMVVLSGERNAAEIIGAAVAIMLGADVMHGFVSGTVIKFGWSSVGVGDTGLRLVYLVGGVLSIVAGIYFLLF